MDIPNLKISDLLDKLKKEGNSFISLNCKDQQSDDTTLLVLVAKDQAAVLFNNLIYELTKDWDASTEKISETPETSSTKGGRTSRRNKLGSSPETPETEK